MNNTSHRPHFFGRRKGKPLLRNRQKLMDELLPHLKISTEEKILAPETLFDAPVREVWMEIGFGAGEHLAFQAQNNPQVGIIGVEPFVNGVSSLLRYVDQQDLTNVRIFDGDVRLLLPKLEKHSFGKIFILFPDPWPKKRHHKRRLISKETLSIFHELLIEGGLLRIASDDPSYIDWILNHTNQSGLFSNLKGEKTDWQKLPKDWGQTRYEKKARKEGRAPVFLDFWKE